MAVIGERGLGKSHLMAALYHAVNDPASTEDMAQYWATTLGDPSIRRHSASRRMLVLGKSLHRQRYKFLWDILLELIPNGTFIRGKWEGMGARRMFPPIS